MKTYRTYRNTLFAVFALVALTLLPAGGYAEGERFILTYQGDNRWVAKEDATPLRKMIKTAQSTGQYKLEATLPAAKRQASVERLIVLRDILEKQLDKSFVIQEVTGEANANTILLTLRKL